MPGVIDHEDIAVTGAGGSEKAVSWLYDFEEQEGDLDFLARVAVFTFYAGSPGVPVTIGEVILLHVIRFMVVLIQAGSSLGDHVTEGFLIVI